MHPPPDAARRRASGGGRCRPSGVPRVPSVNGSKIACDDPVSCSAAGMRATTLARIELRRSPCSPLPRFLVGAPAGLLRPSFRATLLPSEVRRRSLRRLGCLDLPAPASYLASHRELSGGRQRFWACISFRLPHSPLPDCRLTRDNILDLASFFPRSWRWRRWPWWSRRWWFGLGGLRRLKY
jgi:hypothetical protein